MDGGWSNPWEEMKAYVGFDEADMARLAALRPAVEPRLQWLVDNFYATVLRFPDARTVLQSEGQVARLKGTLKRWVMDMLTGPYDDAYWERRKRIGQVHVKVGLAERYVFAAMNLIRRDLCQIAREAVADGEERWVTCMALHRITDLELAAMSAAFHEAHELRRLQSLQDLIVQNLPITVLLLDQEGRVTSATRPSASLFGTRAEVGQHYLDFLPEELVEVADLPAAVSRALATDRDINIPRIPVGSGPDRRTFRVSLVPLEDETARMLIHVEELTDVVQSEARLQQSEALARIGSLAANVAHEIRNPLAAISATLQVIVGSEANDRRKIILGKVQEQVHRLDRLVSDLLGYARPAEARLEPVPLAELAREAVVLSGARADMEVLEDPLTLADGQYVQQILVNLLQNARDAAGAEGGVVVRVGPGPTVEVEDDGPGVSAEVAGKLFEPFVTTKTRGTGLGLAISRKLAEAMGGSLELVDTSKNGHDPRRRGATFRLALNRATGPRARASRAGNGARIG